MAGEISPNVYSGGNVALNSEPATQFYLNSMARKRAQDEALSRTYLNLPNTVNSAGLRTVDQNGFSEGVDRMKQFYQQNADAIKDPRIDKGRAYQLYEQMHLGLNNYVDRSKNRAQNMKQIAPILADPKKRGLLAGNSIDVVHNLGLPINDPNSYKDTGEDYGIDDLNFDDAKITDQDWNRFTSPFVKRIQNNGYTLTALPVRPEDIDNKAHQKTERTQKQLNPAIANDILVNAATNYHSQPRWQSHVDDLNDSIKDNPQLYDYYNNIYKKFYPNKGNIADDFSSQPEKLLAAETIARMGIHNEPDITSKVVPYNPFLGQRTGRSGSAAASSLWANNTASIMQGGNQDAIKSQFEKLFAGNTGNKYQSYEQLPNGHYLIHYKGDRQVGTHTLHNQDLTEELDPNDPSLKYRLEGTYQRHMGSESKGEGQIVNEGQPQSATPASNSKIKVNWAKP